MGSNPKECFVRKIDFGGPNLCSDPWESLRILEMLFIQVTTILPNILTARPEWSCRESIWSCLAGRSNGKLWGKSGQVNTCEHLDHVCRVEWKSYESAQVIVCRGSDSCSDMKSRVDPKMPYKWGKRSSKPGFCPCRPQWIFNDFPTSGHQHLQCRAGHYQRQNHLTHRSLPRIRTTHITPRKCTTKQFKDMVLFYLFSSKNGKIKTPFPAVSCSAPSLEHAKLAKLATGGYRHDGPPGCQRVHPAFPASVPMEVQKCLDLLGMLVETAWNSVETGWNMLKLLNTRSCSKMFLMF